METNLLIYFIIYSFLGWLLESVYKTIIFKKVTNSGFLYGPVCPMYGIAAVMMILLSRISNNLIIIFILSFFAFSIWEYIVGFILEKCFKTKYWDYSDLKFNIKGRVCLKNSIYWGILGVILIFVIQPLIENAISYIPEMALLCIEIILTIAVLSDAIITIFKTMIIHKKIEEVFEIGSTIKEKLTELKEGIHQERETREHLQNIIDDLKQRQDNLKIKVYKKINRLKKAFPEMHSENITRFMKQKNWIEDIKDKIKKYKER